MIFLVILCARTARPDTILVGEGQVVETIQAAISAANDGDILVAVPGTYNEPIDFLGKKITVKSQSGNAVTFIDVTGLARKSGVSFATNETAESVLEGFTITGGTGTTISGTITGGGGIYIVDAAPTIRDCVVRLNTASRGGGVYIEGSDAGGLIEDCFISENISTTGTGLSGGGIQVVLSGTKTLELVIRNTTIDKNWARTSQAAEGGGGWMGGSNLNAKISLINCKVLENVIGGTNPPTTSQGLGGGLYLSRIPVLIEGGEISSNVARKGGGIAADNLDVDSKIGGTGEEYLLIQNNAALGSGGGGGVWMPNLSTGNVMNFTLERVRLVGNTGGSAGGGGLLVESGMPIIESCWFESNATTQDGGAIRFKATATQSVPTVVKTRVNATMFYKNQSSLEGGAIYVSGSSNAKVVYTNCIFSRNRGADGGAIKSSAPNENARTRFLYCTFHANESTNGTSVGGIQPASSTTPLDAWNSIFWENIPNDFPTSHQSSITYSDVQEPILTGNGMLNEVPLFVGPDEDPPVYLLPPESPLIDKGQIKSDTDAPGEDFKGEERIADGNGDGTPLPDMGAYELVVTPADRPEFVRGYCRHPGTVLQGLPMDITDPIYLLRWSLDGMYDEPGCRKSCDADDSGEINLSDAIYMLTYLFQGGPAPKEPFPEVGEDPTFDLLDCKEWETAWPPAP